MTRWAEDGRAFDRFADTQTMTRLRAASVACAVVFGLAWAVGRLVLRGQAVERPGRVWVAVLTAAFIMSFLWLRSRWGGRHPDLFGILLHCAIAAGAGRHLGLMGGLDGPFFYAIYAFPPISIGLPLHLPQRIAMAVLGSVFFGASYFGPHPEYLSHPMLHIPLFVLSGITLTSIAVGHHAFRVSRERFLLALDVERSEADLLRRATLLEKEVQVRTEAVDGLVDRLEHASVERADVARALHDDLGQLIVGLRIELDLLERTLGRAPIEGPIAPLAEVVDTLDSSVREFIERVQRPLKVDDLTDSLQRLIAPLNDAGAARIEFEALAEVTDLEHASVLYRCAQEALSNALKHADATSIRLRVEREASQVVLTAQDDGRGFDPARSSTGMGLDAMRKRLRRLGGTLTIDSSAQGSTLRCALPAEEPT